ncbi:MULTISPECIES: hypothetical protein [Pseudomonas]|uniref:hypothetical protein n=1 Tax=Pseudomonas TaxID=286 RepID=UPI000315E58D|nr:MULTISPECIES: hypothetical protein [Pseudomonas]ROM93194.1 hypothetical protein BK656_18900 [Pseudomonas brassicacearum]RON07251.1 hypothetical protein BK657_04825 [Pseudomonas brassicacearum]
MPFEVADISITAWSLMSPTYETLKPHEALIKRFLGSDLQVRFPTTQAAAQALAQPAQAFPLKWRVGATPLAEANQSINQCLDALALYLRDQDKRKYQDMLDEANATGGSLFTDARKNIPAQFVGQKCTYYYQGAYMSGDQFAVGAALRHDPSSRLILLYAAADEAAAKRLVKFYGTSCGVKAARLLPVLVTDAKAACETCRLVVDARINKSALPPFTDAVLGFLAGVANGAKLCPVGGATTDVAASVLSGDGKGSIAKWDNVDPNTNRYWAYRLDKFLGLKGVVKGQSYVIVWTRFSGKDGGAHPELDDSWTGLGQVCHRLLKKGRNVIVVGRPRTNRDLNVKLTTHLGQLDQADGLVSRANLQVWGEYWKLDNGNPNQKIIGPNRAAEYAIFLRMKSAEWNCKLVHLGMRSGAMDAAALLGMRTRFIENAGNEQIARTTKWTGATNTNLLYQRIPVAELPTWRARGREENLVVKRGYLPTDLEMIVASVEGALT